jgi:hypothetical protein
VLKKLTEDNNHFHEKYFRFFSKFTKDFDHDVGPRNKRVINEMTFVLQELPRHPGTDLMNLRFG